MDQPLLIKSGRIIDPGRGLDKIDDLLIRADGTLAFLDKDTIIPESEYRIIDADGMIICPGFIDLHCHLRQPGYEDKETIATGTQAAAKGGFTTVCCMPNTNPALDNPETVKLVQAIAEKESPIRVLPIASITKGRQGQQLSDFRKLASLLVAGFSDDGSSVTDENLMCKALMECQKLGLPLIEHCEVPELAGDGVINEGKISKKLGLLGIPDAAEEQMVARDIRLAAETGGWVHIAHASTSDTVELVRRAKSEGIYVTAEVTPHHLTLTEDEVVTHGTAAKVNPPLRTQADINALIEGLNDGTIDIIVTDHAPHTDTDKVCTMAQAAFGISVFETALGSLMTLVHNGRITMNTLVEKLTRQPAILLGERYAITGMLEDGKAADLVIIDPDREWVVYPEEFVSRGKNTPLAGSNLKGKVMMTISKGELVYKDEALSIQ
ncbi:MAG: dihydroorotase [Dehalococcoidales bacterium]|nr:MAG: dihydroorotase [Dehalococcoidales bacterium]